MGIQKIFNNLMIVSNNVQPKELEFELIGDSYDFNKAGIYWNNEYDDKYNALKSNSYKMSQSLKNAEVVYNEVTNTYALKVSQDCINMKEAGRLQGNIQYKEDAWNVVFTPIKFTDKQYDVKEKTEKESITKTARMRDKYLKIRVKYTGKDLAIISALRTLYTLSYA